MNKRELSQNWLRVEAKISNIKKQRLYDQDECRENSPRNQNEKKSSTLKNSDLNNNEIIILGTRNLNINREEPMDYSYMLMNSHNENINKKSPKMQHILSNQVFDSHLVTNLSVFLREMIDTENRLALVLDNKYNLSLMSQQNGLLLLKEADLEHYKMFEKANLLLELENQYEFFIIRSNLILFHCENFNNHDKIVASNKGEIFIAEWFDLKTQTLLNQQKINIDHFLNQLIYTNNNDYEKGILSINEFKNEHYWFKSRNSCNEIIYYKYMLALWPKNQYFDILMKIDFNFAFNILYKSCKLRSIGNEHEQFCQNVEILFDELISLKYQKMLHVNIGKVIEILVHAKNVDLTRMFLEKSLLESNEPELYKKLSDLLAIFDVQVLENSLKRSKKLHDNSDSQFYCNCVLIEVIFFN
jgi:hypothetical protein